ncbi:MAG TPA: hypothetical protein ENK16_09170 [Chromatiales bacterium]|nr:hypothetical protein [Chromatiales bacterium]
MRYGVLWSGVIAAVLLTGCAGTPSVPQAGQYLDERTGVTVEHLAQPAVFYREAPMLAVHARDYLSVAPLILSQAGQRDYLLWVYRWSTIDRRGSPEPVRSFILLVDSEPMELQPALPRTLGNWPYQAPVEGGQQLLFVLTRDQLQRIRQAQELGIELQDGHGEYRLWRAARPQFADFPAGSDPVVALQRGSDPNG